MPVGDCAALGATAPVDHSFHVPLGNGPYLKLQGAEHDDDVLMACGRAAEHCIRGTAGARLAYVVPPPGAIAALAPVLVGRDVHLPEHGTRLVYGDLEAFRELRWLLCDIWRTCLASPEFLDKPPAASSVKHAILERLVRTLPVKGATRNKIGRTPKSRSAILRAVEECLRTRVAEPVQVSDLCEAAGVSQPTLHRVFRASFNLGAKQYLQLWRLHQIRAQLLHAEAEERTVSDIAFDAGFWQLGRFGRAYKRLFGETPSATLRRAKDGQRRSRLPH